MLPVRSRPKDQSNDEEEEEDDENIANTKCTVSKPQMKVAATNQKQSDSKQSNGFRLQIATKQCAPSNIDKNALDGMIFCFYPVDILQRKRKNKYIHIRCTPFDYHYLAAYTSYSPSQESMSSLLQHDDTNYIYYLPLGSTPSRTVIKTPSFLWPNQYTMLMWIRWGTLHTLTTFDSASYTPIVVDGNYIGCPGVGASGYSWGLTKHKVTKGEWRCIIALAQNKKTEFRVGDLHSIPKQVGTVNCNIAGQRTHQLGNSGQGPGDLGCVMVFDRILSDEEMQKVYEESIMEMEGVCWTKEQAHQVREVLMQFVNGIEGIAKVVMGIVLGQFMEKYAL